MENFRTHARYYFSFLLAIFFLLRTQTNPYAAFSTTDMVAALLLIAIACLLQALICHWLRRRRLLSALLLALFSMLNIMSVHIVFVIFFQKDAGQYTALLLGIGLFVLYTVFRMIAEYREAAMALVALVAFAVVATIPQITPAPPQAAVAGDLPAGMRAGSFQETPNVYLISFDALVPQTIQRKFLPRAAPVHYGILDSQFTRFPNAFVTGAPTRPSLNRLLAFDAGVYDAAALQRREFLFVPGWEPSPLLQVFKQQGYTLTVAHDTPFLGARHGPYIDHYFLLDMLTICGLVERQVRPYALLGYCLLQDSAAFQSVLSFLGQPIRADPTRLLISHLQALRKTAAPQFVLAYLRQPGHVPASFDYANPDHIAAYGRDIDRASRRTREARQQLVDFIATQDPGALLYVFGDHGMMLSRAGVSADNKTFLVQDRKAVYSGLHPKDRCASWHRAAYAGTTTTVVQIANMILQCLSGGTSGFATFPTPRITGLPGLRGESYEAYTYE